MAVSDIYNSLTFGGINSLDYGIYISGPGVYDAPTRDVEFVSVPGRNGAIEIDKGHWNNIEVTYHAGVFAGNQEDFGKKINAFRNAIVSQVGYQRLTDTYNADEYRLGIYASGIGASTVKTNEAGEFDLIFNCKPQRYLLEGADEITVRSGNIVTNPTLYEARPIMTVSVDTDWIGVEGAETITLQSVSSGDSSVIELKRGPIGKIEIDRDRDYCAGEGSMGYNLYYPVEIADQINTSDTFTLEGLKYEPLWRTSGSANYRFASIVGASSDPNYTLTPRIVQDGTYTNLYATVTLPSVSFSRSNTISNAVGYEIYVDVAIGSPTKVVVRVKAGIFVWHNIGRRFQIQIGNRNNEILSGDSQYASNITFPSNLTKDHYDIFSVFSTKPIIQNPIYIDTEIGEAYKVVNGDYIGMNQFVSLGSDLPSLSQGGTTITCSEHILNSEVKLIPRWWEL